MRTARIVTALVALLALSAVACGIPEEREPRAVAPDRIPEQLVGANTTPPITTEPTGVRYPIYMLTTASDGESTRLVEHEVNFQGPDTPSPRSMVVRLLQAGPEEPLLPGVFNAIPDEVALDDPATGFEVADDDLARITLNEAIENVDNDRFTQAIAQIVFTATEVGGIDRVQFLDQEGEPIEIPTQDGSDDIVTRRDFDDLAPE